MPKPKNTSPHLADNYASPVPSQTLLQIVGALPFTKDKAQEYILHAIIEQFTDELANAYSAGIELGAEAAFAQLGNVPDGAVSSDITENPIS